MYISYLRMVNFTGVFAGTGRSDVELELPDPSGLPSRLVLLMGANGSGKSTVISHLHPFAGSFDGRDDTMIRDGMDGLKQVQLVRGDTVYDVEHHYLRSGRRTKTRSYIQRSAVGDEESVELNENGGVTTFKEVLEAELGLTEEFFRVGRLASTTANFVELTAAQRKDFVTSHLPRVGPYLEAFGEARKKCLASEKTLKYLAGEIERFEDRGQMETSLAEAGRELGRREKALRARQGEVSVTESRIESILEEIGDEDVEAREAEETELRAYVSASAAAIMEATLADNIRREEISGAESEAGKALARLEASFEAEERAASDLRRGQVGAERELESKRRQLSRAGRRDDDVEGMEALVARHRAKASEKRKSAERLSRSETVARFLEVYGDRRPQSRLRGETRMGLLEATRLVTEYFEVASGFDLQDGDSFSEFVSSELAEPGAEGEEAELWKDAERLESEKEILKQKLFSARRAGEEARKLSLRPEKCEIDSCPFLKDILSAKKEHEKVPSLERELERLDTELEDVLDTREFYRGVRRASGLVRELCRLLVRGEGLGSINVETDGGMILFSDVVLPGSDPTDAPSVPGYLEEKGELFFRGAVEDCKPVFDYLEDLEDLRMHSDKAKEIEERLRSIKESGSLVAALRKELEGLEASVLKGRVTVKKRESKLAAMEERLEEARGEAEKASDVARMLKEHDTAAAKLKEVSGSLGKVRDKLKMLRKHKGALAQQKEAMDAEEKSRDAAGDAVRRLEVKLSKLDEYRSRYESFEFGYAKQQAVRDACDPKRGLPLAFMREFMASTEGTANVLFDMAFRGRFRVGFQVDEKEFRVPVLKDDGDILPDVKYASDGERALVKTIVSLALLSRYVESFPVLSLDEVDACLDDEHRGNFAQILDNQVEELDLTQVFAISHNENFRDPSVSVVLFPGHTLGEGEANPVLADLS